MNEKIISDVVEKVLQNVNKTPTMTLDIAKKLIDCVEKKADEIGIAVVIAVSDDAGRIKAVHSMDNAYIASYDIAVNKTFTSAGLKMSTAHLSELAQPNMPLYGIEHTNDGKIVIFGGGEPLIVNNKVIGALGVSGGSAEQDTMLAAFGKKMLEEVIVCL